MSVRNASRWLACSILSWAGACGAAETLTLGRALERVASQNPALAAQAGPLIQVRMAPSPSVRQGRAAPGARVWLSAPRSMRAVLQGRQVPARCPPQAAWRSAARQAA